jgi:hypothetical protein
LQEETDLCPAGNVAELIICGNGLCNLMFNRR